MTDPSARAGSGGRRRKAAGALLHTGCWALALASSAAAAEAPAEAAVLHGVSAHDGRVVIAMSRPAVYRAYVSSQPAAIVLDLAPARCPSEIRASGDERFIRLVRARQREEFPVPSVRVAVDLMRPAGVQARWEGSSLILEVAGAGEPGIGRAEQAEDPGLASGVEPAAPAPASLSPERASAAAAVPLPGAGAGPAARGASLAAAPRRTAAGAGGHPRQLERPSVLGPAGAAPPGRGRYSLQFGSFAERARAEGFAAGLGLFIEPVRISTAAAAGRVMHQVRAGDYPDRAAAEAAASKLVFPGLTPIPRRE